MFSARVAACYLSTRMKKTFRCLTRPSVVSNIHVLFCCCLIYFDSSSNLFPSGGISCFLAAGVLLCKLCVVFDACKSAECVFKSCTCVSAIPELLVP